MLNLRPARADEIDGFIQLLEDAAAWQHARGIRQWLPGSMAAQRPAIERAQARGDLFVIGADGRVQGGAVLTKEPDPIWADSPAADACYLSKLVVARDCTGQGLGERILTGCERIARERGSEWIRLDCVASNRSLARYYQQRGYYPRGVVVTGAIALLRHDRRVGNVPALPGGPFVADRHATLMFLLRAGEVLLIRKKRGHGAGKINGPGGMMEPGESPLHCALRETREEVGMDAQDAAPLAELHFHDSDGSTLLGVAFAARHWRGEPIETAEAVPFWCPIAKLPYDSMWEDDILWLPWLLEDRPVLGEFLMRDERLVNHRLQPASRADLQRLAEQTIR